MPKDVCTVELPESGTTQNITLTANQVNTLSFPKSCIVGDPKLNADGSVTMDLINGSSVVIENFEEMADAGKACGRDTLIQLSDNAIIYPEELYSQLTSVADATSADVLAAVAPAAGEQVTVNAPTEGSQELSVQAGQDYQFGFDLADVTSMTQQGSDLVLTFGEGQTLTMTDYFTMAEGALPPSISLSDGSVIDAASLLPTYLASRSGDTDSGDLASLTPEGTVLPAEAAIEPAAGEEGLPQETTLEVVESTIVEDAPEEELASVEETVVAEETEEAVVESTVDNNTDVAALAEQLAEIEPAAGETGGAAGSRGGFGFQSGVDDAPLINDPAIGPHGYTALEYDIPEFVDEPFAQRSNDPDTPFDPPKFDIPSLVVKEDSSVDVVIDAPSPSGVDTLTVEIDVPVGWTVVDLNGGTYDAGTGIWTFTTAVGDDFLGGPEVAPPPDSDIDSEVLDVRVTRTDTTTGETATSIDTYTILTDAVADTPDVAATNATGEEGTTIPLTITTSTTDVDGSEVIAVVKITNVPAGMTLTAGTEVAPGEWELDVTDLVGLGINVPDGTVGSFTLLVESVADEDPVTDGEFDPTDNQASNFTELVVRVTPDDVPKPVDEVTSIDETNLIPGPLTTNGTVTVDFGTDGPGLITPKAANTFTVNGSVAGGTLSSNGSEITVTLAGNTYTGVSADGRDIFTMTIGVNGSYSFELLDTLDHADATDPNDIIDLHFCYAAEDTDGDIVDGLITVRVADDAPIAADDSNALSDTETVETGNILTNDSFGQDGEGALTQVSFNGVDYAVPAVGTVTVTGDYGVLVLAADGSYTYTRSTDDAGVDQFDYMIVDFDGDQSTATLTITLEDADDKPVISKGFEVVDETDLPGVTESGTLVVDYGTDGPGTVVGNDSFTSSGSQLGGTLTSNGQPVTVDLVGNQYVGTTPGGDVIFTLDIETDGSYEFNLLGTLDHADPNDPNDIINLEFGVVAIDADQDETPTTITVLVKDDVPTIGDSYGDVDETNLDSGDLVYSDTLFTDFGTEVASFAPAGNVRAEVGGVPFALTSGLEPVTLVQTATGYEGTTATNGTVFTLVMDFTTGQYVYTQTATFDHPDGTDPNDTIELLFDFTVESTEGETETGTVTISVADDGPVANDDTNGAAEGQDITGSVTANDDFSEDNPNTVTQVEFGGTTYPIVPGIPAVITTPLGEFTLNSDGSYEFDAVDSGDPDGTVDFTYTLVDSDGDSDTATLSIKVTPDGEPIIVSGENTVDETALTPGPLTVNGSLTVDFGLDGAGNVNPNGTTSFGGSATAGNLTSEGTPVVMQATATGYEGVLQGTTTQVFELILEDNGDYSFELFAPLDHADGTDPNDAIQLNFGVTATDFGGDTDDAIVTINVIDDAPVANDDYNQFNAVDGPASGNVVSGLNGGAGAADNLSEDDVNNVVEVSFGATTVSVPTVGTATIQGDYGTLEISADGSYTYTLDDPTATAGGTVYQLSPTSGDVAGTQETLNQNGITVTIPNAGNFDISWVDTADGSGLGIDNLATGDSPKVWPKGESFEISAAEDAQTMAITIAELGNNNDDGNHGIDYVVTLADGTTVAGEQQFVPGQIIDGHFTFTLDAADFGQPITSVVIESTNAGTYQGASFLLNDVVVTTPGVECLQDQFGYVLQDGDGDMDPAVLTLKAKLPERDDEPEIGDGEKTVDETDLGPIAVSGTVSSDFGTDGPGTITPTGAGSFGASGSVAGGTLTSGGVPVTVEVVGNTYVGTAGTETIFTLVVENDGDFTFNLIGVLDHADTTNPDDIIDLTFGVTGEDDDGDTDTGTITIHVKDDGPYINTKFKPIDESNLDGATEISYTHTLDFDFGSDGEGEIVPTGDFKALFQVGGNAQPLLSGGELVTVTANANGYVGTAAGGDIVFDLVINPTTGEYTYTQYQAIDHPDATDHDDVIWMKFEVQIIDNDGDTDTAIIGVDLHDDGPCAHDDCEELSDKENSKSGNVLANDDIGADVDGSVTFVTFNGVQTAVPTTGTVVVNGNFGDLEIAADGSYTYTRTSDNEGQDSFTYKMQDFDGDTSVANVKFDVKGMDDQPEIGDDEKTVDETDLGPIAVSGNVTSDFGMDGPGTITATGAGSFGASGSVAGTQLTSGGIPVSVDVVGNTYVGTAGGQTVFTLEVQNDGDYTFNLIGVLDHADTTNPDDVIDLMFGVTGEDDDGDTDTGTITIHVKDDGPYINTKFRAIDETNLNGATEISYTHTLDFDFGSDGPGEIRPTGNFQTLFQVGGNNQPLTSAGELVTVTATANGYVGTLAGGEVVLDVVINPTTGEYTYTQYQAIDHPDGTNHDDVIWLKFEVEIVDGDGDTDTAIIGVDVHDDGPCAIDDYYIKVGENTRSVDGNIMANDHVGADVEGSIANIIHDGMQYPIPTGGALILAGDYGKLTIADDGSYTYDRTTNASGIERFQYTLQDADGDTDVAWFKFQVCQGCLKFGPDDLQLNGTAGDDLIVGNEDDNVIDAGAGDNLIYGEGGADTFLFNQADVDASVDRVADFNSGEGDVLDLSDFLQSYDPVNEAIEDFIFQREVNGDTVISVDTSGSGDINNAVDLVVLENVAGEDLDQLVLNAQTTV